MDPSKLSESSFWNHPNVAPAGFKNSKVGGKYGTWGLGTQPQAQLPVREPRNSRRRARERRWPNTQPGFPCFTARGLIFFKTHPNSLVLVSLASALVRTRICWPTFFKTIRDKRSFASYRHRSRIDPRSCDSTTCQQSWPRRSLRPGSMPPRGRPSLPCPSSLEPPRTSCSPGAR